MTADDPAGDAMRTLLRAATEEAERRGDRRLGTDHLLLGLLHRGPVSNLLGVSLAGARTALDALDVAALAAIGVEVATLDGGPVVFGRRMPPLTSGARAVLKQALATARPRLTGRIGSEHFLSALLDRERPDPAAELLQALGVDAHAVRERLAGPDRTASA